MFKLIASLCVVWYHNPLYWNITPSHLHDVDLFKNFFIMDDAFFYTTSIYFILLKKYSLFLTFQKLKHTLALIISWTFIYEISRVFSPDGIYSSCILSSSECDIGYFFEKIRMVNNTPGYYLSEIFSITLVSYFLLLNLRTRVFGIIGICYVAFFNNGDSFGIFLSPSVPKYFLIAFFIKTISDFKTGLLKIQVEFWLALFYIVTLILLFGFAVLVLNHNMEFSSNFFELFVLVTFLFCFLSVDNFFLCKSSKFISLSQLGRKYSFGIFIFHQFCYDWLVKIINPILRNLGFVEPLFQHLILGLLVMALSFLVSTRFKEITPRLFNY